MHYLCFHQNNRLHAPSRKRVHPVFRVGPPHTGGAAYIVLPPDFLVMPPAVDRKNDILGLVAKLEKDASNNLIKESM